MKSFIFVYSSFTGFANASKHPVSFFSVCSLVFLLPPLFALWPSFSWRVKPAERTRKHDLFRVVMKLHHYLTSALVSPGARGAGRSSTPWLSSILHRCRAVPRNTACGNAKQRPSEELPYAFQNCKQLTQPRPFLAARICIPKPLREQIVHFSFTNGGGQPVLVCDQLRAKHRLPTLNTSFCMGFCLRKPQAD